MIVVSDTTAITSLLQVGESGILAKLYHQVLIPEAVRHGLITSVRELTMKLETVAGFRVTDQIKDIIFRNASE